MSFWQNFSKSCPESGMDGVPRVRVFSARPRIFEHLKVSIGQRVKDKSARAEFVNDDGIARGSVTRTVELEEIWGAEICKYVLESDRNRKRAKVRSISTRKICPCAILFTLSFLANKYGVNMFNTLNMGCGNLQVCPRTIKRKKRTH